MGWHLYIRDHRAFRRNNDGSWGWIRMSGWSWMQPGVLKFLASIGIKIRGDGTCADCGIAEFARRYPIKDRRCGGKLRGCLEIEIDEFGKIELPNKSLETDGPKAAAGQLNRYLGGLNNETT